ncbi:hypothetical protein [Acetatifactor muris]|uniref:hypothetical protein n=1 Tax=Acetatifactor muris TaxID=879566 RepID=UPI0023F4DBDA|nr:hypothetical protein [Acetatifactor muris]
MKKKILTIFLAAGMMVSLTACGGPGSVDAQGSGGIVSGTDGGTGLNTDGAGEDGAVENGGTGSGISAPADGGTGSEGGLRPLAGFNREGCNTAEGYYYLCAHPEKLSDGNYGSHLMYMDFASQQEVYLCSNAGCSHDTVECSSVLLYDEFPSYTTLLFVHGNQLYLLSKDNDYDGSSFSSVSYVEDGGETLGYAGDDGAPAVLYRSNLDGTNREKVYTFTSGLMLEDFVLGDENGIYVATKKLTTEKNGTYTYYNSSERQLLYLDLVKMEEREICSMDFEESFFWWVKGCYANKLILEGTDYGREVSYEELFDDDEDKYKELYENSEEVYATLDLNSGQLNRVYSISNRKWNSAVAEGGVLYVSTAVDNSVKAVDLDTGEARVLCGGMDQYYYLCDIIGSKIRCENETFEGTFSYIDVNTGELLHSSLVNKSLGWRLEFRAVSGSDVLVIYDYEATPNGDGSYEITRYQYGLITQEDLFAGRENYRTIHMIKEGW